MEDLNTGYRLLLPSCSITNERQIMPIPALSFVIPRMDQIRFSRARFITSPYRQQKKSASGPLQKMEEAVKYCHLTRTVDHLPHLNISIHFSERDIATGIFTFPFYSVRRLLTGFAIAALIAWKLMLITAMMIAINPPAANNHQLTFIR